MASARNGLDPRIIALASGKRGPLMECRDLTKGRKEAVSARRWNDMVPELAAWVRTCAPIVRTPFFSLELAFLCDSAPRIRFQPGRTQRGRGVGLRRISGYSVK